MPAIVYFHENQLVYPNRHTAEWDFQFPLTNITSALAAERCVFNPRWNRERFVDETPAVPRASSPDHHPKGVAEAIAAKSLGARSAVRPHGFRRDRRHSWGTSRGSSGLIAGSTTRIPRRSSRQSATLAEEGLEFEVAVADRRFATSRRRSWRPRQRLGSRLVHLGEPESREAYARLLAGCDVAVSTAVNEFFGIAMVESAYAGCLPLVPDRLFLPELYPPSMRYAAEERARLRLARAVCERPSPGAGGRMRRASRSRGSARVPAGVRARRVRGTLR